MNDLVVIIPAYNEEENIGAVITDAQKYIKTIIVVDDGSRDGTGRKAEGAGVTVLRHAENFGKGAALKSGFAYVFKTFPEFRAVITLDGDGQHNPEEIPKFINIFEKTGADLVIGERLINRKEMPLLRRIGNNLISWLISRKIGQKISDSQTGFRLLSGRFLKNLYLKSSGYGVETEILLMADKNKFKIITIPVLTAYQNKKSLNFLKDTRIIFSVLREIF